MADPTVSSRSSTEKTRSKCEDTSGSLLIGELAAALQSDVGLARTTAYDIATFMLREWSEQLYNKSRDKVEDRIVTEDNALEMAYAFMRTAVNQAVPRSSGAGIVICAGGYRLFKDAWRSINVLRRHGCVLPVEIWLLGEREWDPILPRLFADLDVAFRKPDATGDDAFATGLTGWPLKVYALLRSSFAQVLLLDADNVALADPTPLFADPSYERYGAMFWPDFSRLDPRRRIWALCGLPPQDALEIESGQIVVDRSRCWPPLLLAMYMNHHSQFYYRYVHGDKDIFQVAWKMHRRAYYLVPHAPVKGDGYTGQHHPDGSLLFKHYNRPRSPHFEFDPALMDLSRAFDALWSARRTI